MPFVFSGFTAMLTQDYCGWIGGAVGWEEEAEEEAGAEEAQQVEQHPTQQRIQNRISAVFGGPKQQTETRRGGVGVSKSGFYVTNRKSVQFICSTNPLRSP